MLPVYRSLGSVHHVPGRYIILEVLYIPPELSLFRMRQILSAAYMTLLQLVGTGHSGLGDSSM